MELVLKTASVVLMSCSADEVVSAILRSYEDNFFTAPLSLRFKVSVEPETRLKKTAAPCISSSISQARSSICC